MGYSPELKEKKLFSRHHTITRQTIGTLKSFYDLMAQTRQVRLATVNDLFSTQGIQKIQTNALKNALSSLEECLADEYKAFLKIDDSENIEVDLTYEVTELKKDIYAELQEDPEKGRCQRKNVPLFEEHSHNQLVC